jgi:hypothetical protein
LKELIQGTLKRKETLQTKEIHEKTSEPLHAIISKFNISNVKCITRQTTAINSGKTTSIICNTNESNEFYEKIEQQQEREISKVFEIDFVSLETHETILSHNVFITLMFNPNNSYAFLNNLLCFKIEKDIYFSLYNNSNDEFKMCSSSFLLQLVQRNEIIACYPLEV